MADKIASLISVTTSLLFSPHERMKTKFLEVKHVH
jgi:hypothetical protein